ncbi:MAG: AMP-binding protein [Novosphingobium sp.]
MRVWREGRRRAWSCSTTIRATTASVKGTRSPACAWRRRTVPPWSTSCRTSSHAAGLAAGTGACLHDPDPLVWLFYTSGTTGTPKGAMYTEETVRNTFLYHAEKPGITLSFMPMSHAVGYGYLYLALANGGCSYCSPKSDLSTLFEDLALVRPTMSSLVPRVCEMLYQHYLGEVDRRIAAGAEEAAAQAAVKLDMRENLLGGRLLWWFARRCSGRSAPVHAVDVGVHMAIGYSSTRWPPRR